jgi:outer membrane protein assembly factor BamB
MSSVLACSFCREIVRPIPGGGALSRVLWRIPSDSSQNQLPHEPAVNADGSMAYFVTTDYRLKKIRGADGKIIWNVDVGPVRATFPGWNVVLAGGTVAFAKVDLFGYDTTTGRELWSYVAPGGDPTGYTSITSDDSTVYSASWGGRAYAIDARTGRAKWITDLQQGRPDVFALHPTFDRGVLYVATHSSAGTDVASFWALHAFTGAVKWKYDFARDSSVGMWMPNAAYGGSAVWRDLVIEPVADGRVFAFDRETGAIRWIAPRVHLLPPAGTSLGDMRWPVVFGENLVITTSTSGVLVSLDPATGAERWRNTDFLEAAYRPAMDDQSVYVPYGTVFAAFDVSTGHLRWKDDGPFIDGLRRGTPFQGRPAIASDRLYVGGLDGSYALKR